MTLKEALSDKVISDMSSKTFNVSRYKSDNGFELGGLVVLGVALAASGAAIGWLAHFISQWFYLILLFPLGMGVALGAAGSAICTSKKIRNPLVGGMFGLLAGCFAMGMMHFMDYQGVKKEFAVLESELRPLLDASPEDQMHMIENEGLSGDQKAGVTFLVDLSKRNSFPGYMLALAHRGVNISKVGRSDKGINLGFYGSFVYWVVEVLLVGGVCFFMLREACQAPFCKGCSSWKKIYWTQTLPLLCGDKAQLKGFVESGNLAKVTEWMEKGLTDVTARLKGAAVPDDQKKKKANPREWDGHVGFQYAACEKCQASSTVDLKVEESKVSRKGEMKMRQLVHVTYPADSRPLFVALFAAADKASS